jgi:hypothetical protein
MPEITREEMLNWLNNWYCQECAWPLVDEEDAYFAIRALLTSPPDRDDAAMREKVKRLCEMVHKMLVFMCKVDEYNGGDYPVWINLRAALAEVEKNEAAMKEKHNA